MHAIYMLYNKQGVLVASLREHTAAVNRLAVTQDQSFFASASSDGTCKVCYTCRNICALMYAELLLLAQRVHMCTRDQILHII
jgi:hypothetical protein